MLNFDFDFSTREQAPFGSRLECELNFASSACKGVFLRHSPRHKKQEGRVATHQNRVRYSHSQANAKILRRASREQAPFGFRLECELDFASFACKGECSRHSFRHKKQEGCDCIPLVFCGGESEIRTHGTVLAFTRFPVVRLRPAQPSLHADPYMISQFGRFVKHF